MAHLDKKALEKLGFTDEQKPRAASAVISIAGKEGTGKTHWALSAPKPLFYQSTDYGDDGVIQKATGQIIRPPKDYKLDIPHEHRAFIDRDEKSSERRVREGRLANFVHDNFYKPFYDDYVAAIKAGVRTIVWDNAVDVWEYTRLSVYGREATNRSDLQSEANAKFREMVRLANVHGIVLIMINHLKIRFESYTTPDGDIKWRPSKEFEMQGFDKCPMLVTMNLWTKFTEPDSFELVVKKCRDNPQYVGQTLPAMPFPDLMAMLVPTVEDWD